MTKTASRVLDLIIDIENKGGNKKFSAFFTTGDVTWGAEHYLSQKISSGTVRKALMELEELGYAVRRMDSRNVNNQSIWALIDVNEDPGKAADFKNYKIP